MNANRNILFQSMHLYLVLWSSLRQEKDKRHAKCVLEITVLISLLKFNQHSHIIVLQTIGLVYMSSS